MPSCPDFSSFAIFLEWLWVNQCIFSPSVLFWVCLTLFPCSLSNRLFYYFFLRSHILLQICFVSLLFSCFCLCAFFLYLPVEFFPYFGVSCSVCIVLSYLNIFLVYLLLPVTFGLFPRAVMFFPRWVVFFFSSEHVPAFFTFLSFFFALSFLLVVIDFFFAFPVEFPIQVLSFSPSSLVEYNIHLRLISLQHRLVRLTPWCFSSGYVLIICWFFSVSALTVFQS